MVRLASKFSRSRAAYGFDRPLSDDEIRNVCPAVFAEEAHDSRSSRYTYLPTIQVVQGLRENGFEVFSATQAIPRAEERFGFAKHMLRLRRSQDFNTAQKQGVNEIILLNSHDGSTSYQLIGGHFRFVCSNGLILGDTYEDQRIQHKGDIVGNVIDGCIRVVETFDQVDASRDALRSIQLDTREQEIFANSALRIRYEEGKEPINATQILRPRRAEDHQNDLWTIFNRVQENMIRGGIRGRNKDTRSITTTREVKGIDQTIGINRALWTLAEAMKDYKA